MDIRECSCTNSLNYKISSELHILIIHRNYTEKTIEGDLFAAMVAAGAISKANADDPKKSSLVRCARTDKGVHAAGNVISLKLILEDENIVQKINSHLSPQIRVFGISRTNSSFSAYQTCDSRIYEYLIPTHCFLPPHPESFLGKQIVALAVEAEDLEGFWQRQSEVSTFWTKAEEKYIKPVLEQLDPSIQSLVLQALYNYSSKDSSARKSEANDVLDRDGQIRPKNTANPGIGSKNKDIEIPDYSSNVALPHDNATAEQQDFPSIPTVAPDSPKPETSNDDPKPSYTNEPSPLEIAIKSLKTAYLTARNAYRIDSIRVSRIRSALAHYIGTHNYHNYTVGKTFRDASAKRIIRTFTISDTPMIVNNTEWLSLKVHGQSFMMHQIRKMVSMAAMVVRCGCEMERMEEGFSKERISIPKAPGLGLLLERPVFDNHNEQLEKFGRDSIDFSIHEKEMKEFKQREIYERIFREEERDHTFHSFFASIDNLRSTQMLYVSSLGLAATNRSLPDVPNAVGPKKDVEDLSSDDEAIDGDEG